MKLFKIICLGLFVSIIAVSCKDASKGENQEVLQTANNKNLKNIEVGIEGMTCQIGCAKTIESKLSKMEGISSVTVSFEDKLGKIVYDADKISEDDITKKITSIAGGETYTVSSVKESSAPCCKAKSDTCAKKCADAQAKCKTKCEGKDPAKCTAMEKACCTADLKSCTMKCSESCTKEDCAKCAATQAECKEKCAIKKQACCDSTAKACEKKCSESCTKSDCEKCSKATAECKVKCASKK